MERADEPSVAGTPINKALFDSIASDLSTLNSTKLNIADKATSVEAQAGIDNTKYMTPQTVQNKLDFLIKSVTKNVIGTHTICTFSDYSAAKIITISGKARTGSNGRITINGSNIRIFATSGGASTASSQDFTLANYSGDIGFEFRFDMNSNSFTGYYPAIINTNTTVESICGSFTSLTNFQIKLNSTSGVGCEVTIQISN